MTNVKRFVKTLASLALAFSFGFGMQTYNKFDIYTVYAADDLTLTAKGSSSGTTQANEGKVEVRFTSPYSTLDQAKNAGYTKLIINFNISKYAPKYTDGNIPGIMPFVTGGIGWKNQDVWHSLSDGSSGTVELDFSNLSNNDNGLEFGAQIANVDGDITYDISAKLTGSGSSSGGNSGGGNTSDTINDNNPVELNYAKLLQESLYFYDANMCGSEVDEHSELSWRGDCHTSDSQITYNGKTIDLSGGFHDAGDHVKFGLPGAYSASILGVTYMEYNDAISELGLNEHYKRIMDHFADYFKKCTVRDSSGAVEAFCVQVGDGYSDHSYGGTPENQTGQRPAFFTSAAHPCTDITCETAAALALHYINFGDEESLEYAKALFEYAQNNTKETSSVLSQGFYDTNTYGDDYSFAAAMLYKATSDEKYKNAYSTNNFKEWVLNWENVTPLAVLYAPTDNKDYSTVLRILSSEIPQTNSEGFTSLGGGWGTARFNSTLQFTALLTDKMMGTDNYHTWAEGQMSYILGNNAGKHCFVIGYNDYSVINSHHRAVYGTSNFESGSAPKHLLLGALVGGPGSVSSSFNDSVSNYQETEVALDYNAGLVASAAAHYTYIMEHGTDEEKALQKTVGIKAVTCHGLSTELRTLTDPITGDVNSDGKADSEDVALVLKYVAGEEVNIDKDSADINKNSKVDVMDAVLILKEA